MIRCTPHAHIAWRRLYHKCRSLVHYHFACIARNRTSRGCCCNYTIVIGVSNSISGRSVGRAIRPNYWCACRVVVCVVTVPLIKKCSSSPRCSYRYCCSSSILTKSLRGKRVGCYCRVSHNNYRGNERSNCSATVPCIGHNTVIIKRS